jgi:DNA-binding SARP family transcriptional activator/DNA-binding beta-propeller fold protein YncE
MEFRILGPLEIVGDHGPVTLHRGKEQALLAFMLLHPNELLPSDRLIDELWDGRPPATAGKILQNAVSQLRKALGDGRLETRPPGYVFHLERGELDLQRFEELARDGRSADALALWRGPPLVDLRDERFAEDARRRLEDGRLAVVEDRIDADLEAGESAQLVPELEQLVAEHPLRERMQGQLMRALYAAGRQADALEAYRRARRILSEELGLEPGPELQELERKILQQDPALAPPRPKRSTAQRPRRRRRLLLAALALVIVAAVAGVVVATTGGDTKPILAAPNSLAVIDPNHGKVVGVVPIGDTPRGVAVGEGHVWAANAGEGTVSMIDPRSLRVRTIGVGADATDLVVANGQVWVAAGNDNKLIRLDAHSGGVLDTTEISSDRAASAYAITAGDGSVWVASGDTVYKVDAATQQFDRQRRYLGEGINDLAVHAGSIWLVTSAQVVSELGTSDLKPRGAVDLGVIPISLAIADGSVWVGAQNPSGSGAALFRLDELTARVRQTIPLGGSGYPPSVEVTNGGGAIWVASYDRGEVIRIDPQSGNIVARIKVGGHPTGIAYGAGRVWVTVS